jgi:preprotein translocase subunit SecG
MKKRGMTDFLKNFLFILGIFFSIFFVVIIVYNISQIEPKVVESVDLKVDKQSVKVDDTNLFLTLKGTENLKYLEQVKFILYDGEKIEEIILNATDLKKNRSSRL